MSTYLSCVSVVKRCNKSFFLHPISSAEVKLYIKLLNSNKSTRSDCPPIKVVKLSSLVISGSIAHLINQCIEEDTFIINLKQTEIIAVFKKGETQIIIYRFHFCFHLLKFLRNIFTII